MIVPRAGKGEPSLLKQGMDIPDWVKTYGRWLDRKLVLPFTRSAARFFARRLDDRLHTPPGEKNWKEQALDDFHKWLQEAPDTPPTPESLPPDACDLYTLLSEFAALRTRIQKGIDTQAEAITALSAALETHRNITDLFADRTESLAELENRLRREIEKYMTVRFLDVRDVLAAEQNARKDRQPAAKGLFKSQPPGANETDKAIDTAVIRFDRALSLLGIEKTSTVGGPFDPETMKAVEKRVVSEREKGIVLAEILSGFTRNGEILRTAEVVVGE